MDKHDLFEIVGMLEKSPFSTNISYIPMKLMPLCSPPDVLSNEPHFDKVAYLSIHVIPVSVLQLTCTACRVNQLEKAGE